jgi:UDP-2,3-diacylglucosamine hydrolase
LRKLGLIAGGGDLPIRLARQCETVGRPLFVIRLKGMADPALKAFDGVDAGIAELGKGIASLKAAGCEAVCLAGVVKRPDFAALKPDLRGLKALPGVIAAARRGDDALLRFLVGEFEAEGFHVEGAHEVAAGMTLAHGPLGRLTPRPEHMLDVYKAFHVAGEIGRLDVGQGAVVCEGLVLAVEAQEGTDDMLARCAGLPETLHGSPGAARGVLAKRPKPIQEQRVDLPAIGVATVLGAAKAGLAGIVAEAGKALVMDHEAVAKAADELGLFVYGLDPGDLPPDWAD